MPRQDLARFPNVRTVSAFLLLLGALTVVGAASPAASAQSDPLGAPPCLQPVEFNRGDFPRRPVIDNKWLPLIPGTQLTLEGRANRGGGPLPHTVTFTVTDLTKVINGVRTRVVWDVDVNEGELAETELAFFAQDRDGNVWNLGEYPEEFDGGTFLGAPSTWIAGVAEAQGGLHMMDFPLVGHSWLQGYAPTIDFLDCAEVVSKGEEVCVPADCYHRTLLTHETSPLDPEGGIQTKHHAPGVGIVQVGAVDDPEGETLVLTSVVRLDAAAMEAARKAAQRLDARGYAVSGVYGSTPPVEPRGATPQPGQPGAAPVLPGVTVAAAGGSGGPPSNAGGPPPGKAGGAAQRAKYTHKVDHPLVPLTSVRRTVFEGREGDTRMRVVSRVRRKTRRVAGVRTAIVDVREFEDGELVEHTNDYFAQDRKGRVWYFGERVDDIENGKVVGHSGQWLAGKRRAKPGLFMPAEPRVGRAFRQERAPGVAEDRSRVVAVGLDVTTRAGRFDDCIKTRDFAPLDKRGEFKFYCAGVGLVREKPPDGRLDLVSYR